MILQTANIVSGFILAVPKLQSHEGTRKHVNKVARQFEPYRVEIGLIVLFLGSLGLLTRLGLIYPHIPMFGASFPQSLPAIATGLILAESFLKKYPKVEKIIAILRPHQIAIGLVAVVSGLGSLLFGCIVPIACGVSF